MLLEVLTISLYVIGAFFAAVAAQVLFKKRRTAPPCAPDDATLVFLVRDGSLIDSNFAGQRLLDAISGSIEPTAKLKTYLAAHFDNADKLLSPPDISAEFVERSRDGQASVLRHISDGAVRIVVQNNGASDGEDVHTLRAMNAELETLRANTHAAPFLLWRQNTSGEITWVNKAYLDTVGQKFGAEQQSNWPLPPLFPNLRPNGDAQTSRLSIDKLNDGSTAWFDCHITSIGKDFLCTAFRADEAVHSENRRREFTQTLTKTFAELAIGLAIFDRSRRLVLFNPALLDLTSLPTDFLASRPSLISFLDKLRENRVMPEPRDYRAWRKSIADLEAASVDGTYSETWSLPDGHTYHVTGRPHPDGAVALLFEDISAEMSLTRRFRTELEQSQSVIDALEDGIAVFSTTGQLTLTNLAYRELWGVEETLAGIDVNEASRQWHLAAVPTPIWGDFREFAQTNYNREEWSAPIHMKDGRKVDCRFLPQKGGGTLAVFRITNRQIETEELKKVM